MNNTENNNLNNWAISDKLYEWILSNINKGQTILEFGSGTGTIELCKYYNMYSIEHDEKYMNLAEKSNYILAPIKNGWYDIDKIKDNIPNYDLLLIDGPPGNIGRSGFLKHLDIFNLNVPIIIDDTNRVSENELAMTLAEHLGKNMEEIKDGNGSFIIIK